MRKGWIIFCLVFTLSFIVASTCLAEVQKPDKDSRELQLQDMLMLMLLPHIEDYLEETYEPLLTVSPEMYPYLIDVINVNRVNGLRGFDFFITIEAVPTVGPHIPVGKDRLTFRISPLVPSYVKLVSGKHLKDPDKSNFPPNYYKLLRN